MAKFAAEQTWQVAHERGDTWQEPAQRKFNKLWDKMKPPGVEPDGWMMRVQYL